MSKFSGTNARPLAAVGPTATTGKQKLTEEGGIGHAKDAKTKLYTLAVTNMVGEDTFYETGDKRDDRFVTLVEKVTRKDPDWVAGFVAWLRNTAQMRSASVVMACEYAHTVLEMQRDGKIDSGNLSFTARQVIDSACQRADEPAEVVAYWMARFGRTIPSAVKRGVGDACQRLYTEYAALKYDGGSRGVRMGDVIELVHPTPKAPWQSELFKYLLTKRHRGVDEAIKAVPTRDDDRAFIEGRTLPKVTLNHSLERLPEDQRRDALRNPEIFDNAGFTWERLGGWLPANAEGKVLDAEAWEAMIPTMGYMALLRNLRNFEEAGIKPEVAARVAARIADPEEVAKSRQFPYRFWSAYKNSGTMFFGPALELALQHSLLNLPEFPGRSEVLIDTSGSMQHPVSDKSKVQMWEIGALFAAALGVKDRSKVDVVLYATGSERLPVTSPSVLRTMQDIGARIGNVGHGTNTWPSALTHYKGHDRILAFTDCQDHPVDGRLTSYGYDDWNRPVARPVDATLPDVPIYVWDLRGYKVSNLELGPKRYAFGGFTDANFKQIPLLERGKDQAYPWE